MWFDIFHFNFYSSLSRMWSAKIKRYGSRSEFGSTWEPNISQVKNDNQNSCYFHVLCVRTQLPNLLEKWVFNMGSWDTKKIKNVQQPVHRPSGIGLFTGDMPQKLLFFCLFLVFLLLFFFCLFVVFCFILFVFAFVLVI